MKEENIINAVKQALLEAKGAKSEAQQLLLQKAIAEPQLLLALTQPFLKGILTHWFERVVRLHGLENMLQAAPTAKAKSAQAVHKVTPEQSIDKVLAMMAAENLVENPEGKNDKSQHAQSIRALAKAFAAKRIEKKDE